MIAGLPESLTIIFDGHCGMCTRTISWIAARDRAGRLTPVPCQAREGVERFGLSRRECEASVWVVTPDGSRIPAGQAVVLVLAVLWQRPWLVTLGRLPGVRQLLDTGYRLVARNRGRFPGVMPWCESHPGDCVGGTWDRDGE
jgi:predicted DCC family thiol-disulfide oxidoreductase YuxK